MAQLRRLILMRHGQSPRALAGMQDHARPLSRRGREDSAWVGEQLQRRSWCPQQVLSSDSQRTRDTWDALSHSWQARVRFLSGLYLAELDAIRRATLELPDAVETLMVLGHNPGWESAVALLSGQRIRLQPATAVLLTGPLAPWPLALEAESSWTLVDVLRPATRSPW